DVKKDGGKLLREDAQAISSTKSFPDLPDLAPPRSENDRGGLFGEDKKPEELRAQWRRAARSHAVWNGTANQKFPTGYGFYLWLVYLCSYFIRAHNSNNNARADL